MRHIATLCLLGSAAALAGCMADMGGKPKRAMAPPPVSATLTSETGVVLATATFTQAKDGIRLVVDGKGLTPGEHGLHIHAVGRCEAPGFTSAGPHWNPTAIEARQGRAGRPAHGRYPQPDRRRGRHRPISPRRSPACSAAARTR